MENFKGLQTKKNYVLQRAPCCLSVHCYHKCGTVSMNQEADHCRFRKHFQLFLKEEFFKLTNIFILTHIFTKHLLQELLQQCSVCCIIIFSKCYLRLYSAMNFLQISPHFWQKQLGNRWVILPRLCYQIATQYTSTYQHLATMIRSHFHKFAK